MKMTHKAYISDKTWRTLDYQSSELSAHFGAAWQDVAMYEGESGLAAILRPTRRKESVTMVVASLGVLAKTGDELLSVLTLVRRAGIHIFSIEDNTQYHPGCPIKNVAAAWKGARASGAAKIGGRISADKKKAFTKEAADRIADRWPLPSKEWPTKALLKEAGISLNTAKAHLGKRPIAQYNYQAKMKRAANKVKK